MFKGFLALGGTELINSSRVEAYIRNQFPAFPLHNIIGSKTLQTALEDPTYESPLIDNAPWVNPADPATHRFYGLYPLDIAQMSDSTRSLSVTENTLNGGTAGSARYASKTIKVSVLAIAEDELALEAGLIWLRAAVDTDACGMHDSSCGTTDLRFFLADPDVCDPSFEKDWDGTTYQADLGTLSPDTSPIIYRWDSSVLPDQPSHAFWTFLPADGAYIQWGARDLDDDGIISISDRTIVQRTNFVDNPSFSVDNTLWTVGGGTAVRQAAGGADGGAYCRVDQTIPLVVRANFAPDPGFVNTDPQTSGWRLNGATGVTAVGGAHGRFATISQAAGPIVAEFSTLGPTVGGAGNVSFYLGAHTQPVTVTILDNLGALISTTVVAPDATDWDRTVIPVTLGANYVVRFTVNDTSFKIAGMQVETGALGAFFTGGDAGSAGVVYEWAGAPLLTTSRKVTGTSTTTTMTPATAPTPTGQLIAHFAMRSLEGATVTAQLVNITDSSVLASVVIPSTTNWTRYVLSTDYGRNIKLVLSANRQYDVDQALMEAGAIVWDYFDGDTPVPAGYTGGWVGVPSQGASRITFDEQLLIERADSRWRPFITALQGTLDVTLNWWEKATIPVVTQLEPFERNMHDMSVVSGPLEVARPNFKRGAAAQIEIILNAGTPFWFSNDVDVDLSDLVSAPFSDVRQVLTNIVTNPSAEVPGASAVEFTNLITNPSGETATTGYTAIPGTTGVAAVTNPTATTTFGTKVLHCQWSTASTALGGGMSYDVAVTAGQIYSFGIGLIKSSITNLLQMQVEWRTASATISTVAGASFGIAAGATNPSQQLLNLTAPATATIARIKVVSVAGTGSAQWSIGSYLELDGLIALVGVAILPPYFDGSTVAATDFTYAWRGTANASTSTQSVLGISSTYSPSAGTGTAVGYSTTVTPAIGTRASKCEWLTATTTVRGGIIMGNTGTGPVVTVGENYTGSGYVRSNKSQRLAVEIQFYNAANALIGSPVVGAAVVVPALTWSRVSVEATAPAGATHAQLFFTSEAGTGASNWLAGDWLKVDAVMITDGVSLYPYFDGNTTDTTGLQYDWVGTANASASTQTIIVPQIFELVDPTLPPVPSPPRPPAVQEDGIVSILDWERYYVTIPADEVAEWAATVATLTLTTKTTAERQVRVRFTPNPFGYDPERVDPTAYCSEFILSYLPPNTALTVNGMTQRAYASVQGQPSQAADQLLYGTNGVPMSWPELSCGIDYVMTIDVPPTQDLSNLEIDLVLNRRE